MVDMFFISSNYIKCSILLVILLLVGIEAIAFVVNLLPLSPRLLALLPPPLPHHLSLFTFFSLGILNVPWDSLVSISKLWISMSLFFTWYSESNFSPKTTQDLSYRLLQRAARSSLLMAETSGRDPTFSRTASGTPILESAVELNVLICEEGEKDGQVRSASLSASQPASQP